MKLKLTKKGVLLVATPILISILLITARYTIFRTEEELQRASYIKAATELSCESLKNPLLSVDKELGATKTKEIFAKHNFNVDDNEAMTNTITKYSYNESVMRKITKEVRETCVIIPQ